MAFRQAAASITPAARRKARQAALEPIKEAAKTYLQLNGSVVTGALMQSLAIGESPDRREASILGQTTGKVRGYFPSKYAHLVEYSVRAHWQPRRFGGIMHPGHPGYPFMRPALEDAKDEAAKVYFTMIGQVIMASAARSGGGGRRRAR